MCATLVPTPSPSHSPLQGSSCVIEVIRIPLVTPARTRSRSIFSYLWFGGHSWISTSVEQLPEPEVTPKFPALVAVPFGVVTRIFPLVAWAGTVARICVLDCTLKAAEVPLNSTRVVPVKFVPVIVTLVPTGPLVGANEVIVGAGGGVCVTVKLPLLVAVPPGVVTPIRPVVAPVGTVARICVLDWTLKPAEVPLKRTLVAPVKFVPVIVTLVPTGPLVGANEVIVGAGGGVCVTGKVA